MDGLAGVLDGPRAQQAFLLKAVFDGTWSVTIEDRAPLTLVVLTQGSMTFTGSAGPRLLTAGDVVITRGLLPYTIADSPGSPPDIRILPGQVCIDPAGRLLADEMSLGVRTWGNTRAADATTMLIGTYERETSVGSLLLSRLPPDLVLHDFEHPLVDLLAAELVRDEPGQSAVLDRALDLLVVVALRAALATAPDRPADRLVDEARLALEEFPEHPWTVHSLASRVGLSRAALARRFTQQVGVPPLTHLTRWRLAVAADLLTGTDLTLSAIASRVGYANAFALSAAFKREHGTPPSSYRLRHAG